MGRLCGTLVVGCFVLMTAGCGDEDGTSGSGGSASGGAGGGVANGGSVNGGSGGSANTGGSAPGVASECGSVRMTQYAATDRRWCGFDRTDGLLPDFVRAGMTVAIAEPYAGGSYDGEPGEACGECWELTTMFATQLVMVHDLCPVEGNPICAGSHFHFDVSNEVASAVDGGGWLGEGSVRRVPCPVTGNIQAYVSDRNEYGYLKVAFFNHRLPIRLAEYRPVGADAWQPMTRCLARWCVEEDLETFSAGGPGGVFRLTSATGEVAEGGDALTSAVGAESTFDTGAQFAPATAVGPACTFQPPGAVYDESWGGIDGVRWEPNPWGGTTMTEVSDGCADGSASCVLLGAFEESGLHVTYRHVFPVDTFTKLTLWLRARSGGGEVEVAPRSEENRCANPATVVVGDSWTPVEIDIASSCAGTSELHGLTISRASASMDLMVDEVVFE